MAERHRDAGSASPTGGPGLTRAIDVALALLVVLQELALLRGAQLGVLDGAAGWVAVVAVLAVQAGLILVRRTHPFAAYLALAVLTPIQAVLLAVSPLWTWAVLAYAVARDPGHRTGRGAVVLALGWLASFAVSLLSVVALGLLTHVFIGLFVGAAAGVVALGGGVVGRLARAAAARATRRRTAAERAGRAAALTAERERIAEEIGDGVLDGLRRLVARIQRVTPVPTTGSSEPRNGESSVPPSVPPSAISTETSTAQLRAVQEQARAVLAAMRRVLAALRAGDDGADPDPAPDEQAPGWTPPTPDGIGLLTALGVAAFATGTHVLLLAAGPPGTTVALSPLLLPLDSPAALLAAVVAVLALGWWRTAPLGALLIGSVAALAGGLIGPTNSTVDLSWLILVWGAASRTFSAWRSAAVVAAGTVAVIVGGVSHGRLLGVEGETGPGG